MSWSFVCRVGWTISVRILQGSMGKADTWRGCCSETKPYFADNDLYGPQGPFDRCMLRNTKLCIFRAVQPSLFLWKKKKTTPNQELSRPHSVLLDEQFFLRNAPLFGDPSYCGEVGETMNALMTPGVVWELVGVSVTSILTERRRSQKNPHCANCGTRWYVRGFFISKHSPCSSAFLLLGNDFSLLALDHGFLDAAQKWSSHCLQPVMLWMSSLSCAEHFLCRNCVSRALLMLPIDQFSQTICR